MIVDVSYDYWDLDVIPPRCRKPRDVKRVGFTQVEVPEVTGDQAPVAMQYPSGATLYGVPGVFRWWGNQLWEMYLPRLQFYDEDEPITPGSERFPARQHVSPSVFVPASCEHQEKVAALAGVPDLFGAFLIVDGVVWWPADEPRYQVYTMEWDHKYDGTGLHVENSYDAMFMIGASREYFRADQFEAAQAKALRLALAHADTDSATRIKSSESIDVLIPESVRSRPEVEEEDLWLDLINDNGGAGSIERRHVLSHVIDAGSVTASEAPAAEVPVTPTITALDDILNIMDEQGWTDLTVGMNALAFIADNGLGPQFVTYLRRVAADENDENDDSDQDG